MNPIACDRDGRRWVLLATGSALRARLVHGDAVPAVMDLAELVDMHSPVVLSPSHPVPGGYAAFTDTIDLVASDPETASVEQIEQVAAFAKSMVLLAGQRRCLTACPAPSTR